MLFRKKPSSSGKEDTEQGQGSSKVYAAEDGPEVVVLEAATQSSQEIGKGNRGSPRGSEQLHSAFGTTPVTPAAAGSKTNDTKIMPTAANVEPKRGAGSSKPIDYDRANDIFRQYLNEN
ncbi:unnamed protein product [Amoebophrya sp. A25]|nr:unnamed protein product [Amoebophrya sp. A25]|eukprot:GSA25T00025376001.1